MEAGSGRFARTGGASASVSGTLVSGAALFAGDGGASGYVTVSSAGAALDGGSTHERPASCAKPADTLATNSVAAESARCGLDVFIVFKGPFQQTNAARIHPGSK